MVAIRIMLYYQRVVGSTTARPDDTLGTTVPAPNFEKPSTIFACNRSDSLPAFQIPGLRFSRFRVPELFLTPVPVPRIRGEGLIVRPRRARPRALRSRMHRADQAPGGWQTHKTTAGSPLG
jgi:hypothetical protein